MKERIIWLVAASALLILPSASALNCTIYKGDYRSLCSELNSLSIDEDYRESLMNSDLYDFKDSHAEVNLQVPSQQSQITFNSIYDDKISILVRLGMVIFVNYAFFSILTKSSFVRKWLTADY